MSVDLNEQQEVTTLGEKLRLALQLTQTTTFQDTFSEEVWRATYKDHNDETIDDTLFRVASAVASVEETEDLKIQWTKNFYDLLSEFKGTAGGRIYSNAGTGWNGTTLMNCYVGPRVEYDADSLDGILTHLRAQAHTLKSEGGWGENFSYIRPRGAFINGIGVETPGSIKYMELFDKSSEIITSGSGTKSANKRAKGKIRKGAMMGVLDCIGGNTPINTIKGKIPVKELVGKQPYLYCTDGQKNVYVRQALLVWSKGIKRTVRVVFDNDDFIECTPSHQFMKGDGSFVEAKNLSYGDSLAALNKRMLNDYIHISITGSRKSIAEHNAVYEMKFGEYPTILSGEREPSNIVAHHVDHVKWNNYPENIQQMTLREHSIHHSGLLKEMQAKRAKRQKGTTWEEFYGEEKAAIIKIKYTAKRKGSKPWNKGMSGEEYQSRSSNHKVVRVEECVEQEVFDISMPDYHNFVASGVFIHNCWHPDVIEFITAKQQPGRLTKFNMSVNCTDEFMNKLFRVIKMKKEGVAEPVIEEIDKWLLRFPDTNFEKYQEEWSGNIKEWEMNGYPVKVYKTVSTIWLWDLIMESTYNRAEPGILFLDRANYFSPLNYKETITATNPCGEQTLAPGGVCNLGSLNLTQFVNCTGFDLDSLRTYVSYMVRFLDNVNDLSNAPLTQYRQSMITKRRVGVGILGWGSALLMLNIKFGSERANELRDDVMRTIAQTAYITSIDLAEEKGMFAICDPEKHAKGVFVRGLDLPQEYIDKLRTTGIRNSSLLSIQPTGNTSILANVVSGGLEPVFMPEYIRTVIVGRMPEHIDDVTPKWYEGEWYETDMFKFTKEGDEEILRGVDSEGVIYKIDKNRGLTKEVLCEDYGVRYLKGVDKWDSQANWAVTTEDLNVQTHVEDLKGFAPWVDSAMSKTVNVPNEYPFEDFKEIYLSAYKSGHVKGVTTYRAGTMTTVLAAKDEKLADVSDEEIILDDVKLPNSSPAMMKTIRAEGKKWYLTVILNEQQTRPFALFVHTNSREQNVTTHDAVERVLDLARTKRLPEKHIEGVLEKISADSNSAKLTRVISLLLRHGVLIKNIVSTLDKVEDVFVGSFLFQIKKFLSSYIKDGERAENEKCLECGSETIVFSEGCKRCQNCGSSRCG